MEKLPCGSMVSLYEWIIPVYPQMANSCSPSGYLHGPDFVIHDKTFNISLSPGLSCDAVRIWLNKKSEGPIFVNSLSFSLVYRDGQETNFGSKTKFTFDKTCTKEDATCTFQKHYLRSCIFPNSELRIRCRIHIESFKEKTEENGIQDSSLVDELSLQFAEQTLSFTDTILSCCGKEIPVHRFMLAARSPVFKAMFSHEENIERQKGKVE
jgi:hypothetical protein